MLISKMVRIRNNTVVITRHCELNTHQRSECNTALSIMRYQDDINTEQKLEDNVPCGSGSLDKRLTRNGQTRVHLIN